MAPRAAVVAYLALLLGLSFAPLPGATDPYNPAHPFVFATPFVTIGKALAAGIGSYKFAILIGNLLAFMPVGVLVPVIRPGLRRPLLTVVVIGFLLSLAIEGVQLAASLAVGHLYRQADIDDLIVNTCGAATGYVLLVVARSAGRWMAGGRRLE